MLPGTNDKKYIINEISNNACDNAKRLYDIYLRLKDDANKGRWELISEKDMDFEYHTYYRSTKIEINFTDANNHTHNFCIKSRESIGNTVYCEYLFEGGIESSFESSIITIRSYAEWLMLQLWKYNIDAELCKCDRGLSIKTYINLAYDVIVKMIDIVTNNIMSIDWFLTNEPIWLFYTTYYDLINMLPLLREEAAKGRWKDVRPQNFRLVRNEDCALICLDYTDRDFTMKFRVGMMKGGFAAERTDKFMDMFYEFENHAITEEARVYYEKENLKFSEIANFVLDIPFSWKSLFFNSEDGFYINTYRECAFQKYCLMLDCILPLKNKYEASEIFLSPELLECKKNLEESYVMDLEIAQKQEPDHIFNHGYFIEETISDEDAEDNPF